MVQCQVRAFFLAHLSDFETALLGVLTCSGCPWCHFVSFNHLTSCKHVDELSCKDFDVGPPTAWKMTIDPNNLASLDADSNLASDARSFALVRVPLFVKRTGLVDFEVGPINSGQAGLDAAIAELVPPSNLKQW